jgi:hypothetical protein
MERPARVKARPQAKASARRVAVLAVAPDERVGAAAVIAAAVAAEELARPPTEAAAEELAARAMLVAEELAARAMLVAEELAAAACPPPARQIARATRTATWLLAS